LVIIFLISKIDYDKKGQFVDDKLVKKEIKKIKQGLKRENFLELLSRKMVYPFT